MRFRPASSSLAEPRGSDPVTQGHPSPNPTRIVSVGSGTSLNVSEMEIKWIQMWIRAMDQIKIHDGGNVASVPALKGSAILSDKRAEVLSDIREAVVYIEDCRGAEDLVPPGFRMGDQ